MPLLNSTPCLTQPIRLRAYIAANDIMLFVEGPHGWDLIPNNTLGWDKLFGKDCWNDELQLEATGTAGFDLRITTVLVNSYPIEWEGTTTKTFVATGNVLGIMRKLGARIEIAAISQAAQSETATAEIIIPPGERDGSGS